MPPIERARVRTLAVAALVSLLLIPGSRPRVTGDGLEYLAMALRFAALTPPAVAPDDLLRLQQTLERQGLPGGPIERPGVAAPDGRRDFYHFWMYSLLAAPGVAAAMAIGISPVWAFVTLNLALLLFSVWRATAQLSTALLVLVFLGPIVWWLDKVQPEVFTFSLVVVAMLQARNRPWLSMIASALASTQNPPIAVLVLLVWSWHAIRRTDALRQTRFWIATATAIFLVLLHPGYTWVRHGTASLLLGTTRSTVPTFAELSAVVLDLDIGLVANAPIIVLVALAAAMVALRRPRQIWNGEIVIGAIAGTIFLASFAQTMNVHAGGTPGMSRYALWLIALAVPLVRVLQGVGPARKWVSGAAALSSVISLIMFHPAIADHARDPGPIARYVWTQHPSWNNPLTEVFIESWVHAEARPVPVATPGCEKLLIAGRPGASAWPMPCYPEPLPAMCQEFDALCYANRDGARYRFSLAPDRPGERSFLQPDLVWPAAVEPHVRDIYDRWHWADLTADRGARSLVLTGSGVIVRTLAGDQGALAVLQRDRRATAADANNPTIEFGATPTIDGELIDLETGAIIAPIRLDAGATPRVIAIPPDRPLLLLAMRFVKR